MLLLYNFGISLYNLLLRLAAPFVPKARLFVRGRKDLLKQIAEKTVSGRKHVWFHFASLGEFEQGRTVLEALHSAYPEKPIIITFFSPSGYEIRKNYPLAEAVYYLPLDTLENAEGFIRLIQPELAIFTKYEFWHHYYAVLKRNHIPLLLISGIFRPEQPFFRWYGSFYRDILKNVSHFFVQNEESEILLKRLGIREVTISGDTRFDRVATYAAAPVQLTILDKFTAGAKVLIAGSTWPKDEELLVELLKEKRDWKFVIVPHEVQKTHLEKLLQLFPGALRYTELQADRPVPAGNVLIIDTIGLLSSAYQYGEMSYIGGGFGAGIHNTLEAAAFGLPVIFGPKYQRFQEARELLQIGAAQTITSQEELSAAFDRLQKDPEAGKKAATYVVQQTGATLQIMNMIKELL